MNIFAGKPSNCLEGNNDTPMSKEPSEQSQILIYQTEDRNTRLEVRLENETVWLTQNQIAELLQTTKQNISLHIKNIFSEKELIEISVVKESLITAADGKKYRTQFYNLDVIISVGYRVKSLRGTQFRIWATQRLREYIVKGFTLDDERLKDAGGGLYFEELLGRIRDIRSSEKVFWRKVLEIYATSVDYDALAKASQQFFATVQNKMHWAVHGQTAAEVIATRADATRPHMGLTGWAGSRLQQTDVEIAKNYLGQGELETLNRIVTAYLEFAELQALQRTPMYMKDWIAKLDDFLRLSGRDVLKYTGHISHEAALSQAREEYEKYRALHLNDPSPVEDHFLQSVKKLKALPKGTSTKGRTRKQWKP